jgi:hypothetical protein
MRNHERLVVVLVLVEMAGTGVVQKEQQEEAGADGENKGNHFASI